MTTETRRSVSESRSTRLQSLAAKPLERIDDVMGGRARRRVLSLLAAVLGLAAADQATVGASATQLRESMRLSHTDLGLIIAVSGLVAAVVAVPLGALVDRVNRVHLLAAGVATWAVVMAVSAAAQSFLQLILIRCALGAAVAIAAPASASLIGDFFAPKERARVWGYVLAGELVGSGFGFAVAGEFATISWRASFVVLAVPALGLSYRLWRLPEPARGGHGRIPVGATEVAAHDRDSGQVETVDARPVMSRHQRAVRAEAAPRADMVIRDDPAQWPLPRAVRYVLRVRTNLILIVAGAAAYFFFAGARAFGIEYVKAQYGVGQSIASMLTLILGAFALVGVIASGWWSDRAAMRGHWSARVYIGAAMLGAAALALVPALVVTSLGLGVLFLGTASLALAAVNPPLDAGRLDIMHPGLWGRAEAVRTLVKQPAEALAPLLFGLLADHAFGGGQAGLRLTFLIMLAPLGSAAVVILQARKTYLRDVATAAASIERSHA